jgi:hypothetical protein
MNRDSKMFNRVDLDLRHPDGTVERVVVLHQFRTPALAVLGEQDEAQKRGCEMRIAADDMPVLPFKPPRGALPIDLLDKIRKLKVPSK